MFKKSLLPLAIAAAMSSPLLLTACSSSTEEPAQLTTAQQSQEQQAEQQFRTTVDEYFNKNVALNPFTAPMLGIYSYNDQFGDYLSDDYLAAQKQLEQTYLDKVEQLDRAALPHDLQIAYDQFIYDRKMALRGFEFPTQYLPFNQFYSRANTFAELGTGTYAQPFKTVKDYEDFLKKSDGFAHWVDQSIQRMRQGMEHDVVLPQVLVNMVIPQLEGYVTTDSEKSGFWKPVSHMPESFSAEDRERLTDAYREKITKVINPAYTRLADFLKQEYKPRTTVAYGELPNGDAWYQYLADVNTTTTLSAEEIHEIGKKEVARILSEMEQAKQDYGFKGSLKEFFTYLKGDQFYWKDPKQQVADYEAYKAQVDAVLPKYFHRMPKADYVIKPVPKATENSAGVGYYNEGTPDGSRPGMFFVNTGRDYQLPMWNKETLFLHEAAPGHHFQVSIKQELENAPKFQIYSDYTAYSEGWGVYAESLGRMMGLEKDPLQYFGKLNEEMLRAMRLVVDTGLHHYGWNLEQAEQYMRDNSALGDGDIHTEVRRYAAIAGQALSYKIGQLTITRLREGSQQALGDQFDIRYFHDEILDSGALPMTILEAKINNWTQEQLNNQG